RIVIPTQRIAIPTQRIAIPTQRIAIPTQRVAILCVGITTFCQRMSPPFLFTSSKTTFSTVNLAEPNKSRNFLDGLIYHSVKSHFEATCHRGIAPIVAAARCFVSEKGMQRLQRIAGRRWDEKRISAPY
ncbi:MAG: hypothetical protein WCL14_14415, partial [Bacteroidota bacterium]